MPALPRDDVARRRASEAARPAECLTLIFGGLPTDGFTASTGAGTGAADAVAGCDALLAEDACSACAAGACLPPAVSVRTRSALCTADLPRVDIALRRASDAARALEPDAAGAAASSGAYCLRAGADCVRAGAGCVRAGADRERSCVAAEDTVASAALPPLLIAWRLAITSSRVLCVVAVCAIVNPVESTFHPVSRACNPQAWSAVVYQLRPSKTTNAEPWLWV